MTPESFEQAVDCWCRNCRSAAPIRLPIGRGTLPAEKLFGAGSLLPKTHPADRYREIEAFKRQDEALRHGGLKALP